MKLKVILFALLLFTLSGPASSAFAQTAATSLEQLNVRFWPDYDEASVLVLLDGTLPDNTPLPAEITIPIPADAQLHAVAVPGEGGMLENIPRQTSPGAVTFVVPGGGFHVEYYAPYVQDGRTRSFTFSWLSDLDITQVAAEIQQPAAATSLTSDPEAVQQVTGQADGLVYHVLPTQAVGAGLPYTISFSYEMSSDTLTAAQPAPAADLPPGVTAPTAVEDGPNWVLLGVGGLAALALVAGGTWYLATRAQPRAGSSRPRKPAPRRETPPARPSTAAARFCHACGQPAEAGDRFCRTCGTELKS